LIFEDEGFADTRGEVNGGLMDDGGGIDSDEPVDKLDTVVDTEDSLDRCILTSISPIGRFRFLDGVGRDVLVFIEARAATAAFRFDVDDDEEVRFREVVSVEDVVVDRV
jgi:hypothetical protein